jgi:RNA-directed DNA polymerase
MNRFLKHWRLTEQGSKLKAHVIAYADDFVILSRGYAEQAKAWARAVMTRLGLTLNEAKTSLRNARAERFDFLGYSFGPHYFPKNGRRYLGASPSKKSVARLKPRISAILHRGNTAPWSEVRAELNRVLKGWSGYFRYGTCTPAYRAIDNHVMTRVQHFLSKRHKVPSRGTARFSRDIVFGELGVVSLRRPFRPAEQAVWPLPLDMR